MATTTSLSTTYAGQHSGMWVKAALLSGNTLANGGMTIMPNIAYKAVINKKWLQQHHLRLHMLVKILKCG